jgi:hypothetical protein
MADLPDGKGSVMKEDVEHIEGHHFHTAADYERNVNAKYVPSSCFSCPNHHQE